MKRLFYAATLSLSGMIASTSLVYAQAPAVEKKASPSTSDLSLQILSHFQKVFTTAANATDKASAEKAVAAINAELKQVDALSLLLAKAAQPTDAEMAKVAEATAKLEVEMTKQLEVMARNLKDREVYRVLDPAMRQFAEKSNNIKVSMDRLYPAKKMLSLVKAAKARIQLQKSSQ